MRLLTLHSNWIEVTPRQKAIKEAEQVKLGQKLRWEEALVVFTAVEKRDEAEPRVAAENTVNEIIAVAMQIKVKRIVLYPYVHLVSDPAKPSVAKDVLELTEAGLKKKGYETDHAPFGHYKEFTISVKGHPLAELSREFAAVPGVAKIEDDVSGALKQEEKVRSEWLVLTPEGKLVPVDEFDFKPWPGLKKFWKYETAKARAVTSEPPHVRLMKNLELVDYEPGSDPGNLRWLPKGRFIKGLLEAWVAQKVLNYGAVEVETPLMYDYEHPALKAYLNRFPARQYVVKSAKKDFFLRFSACFGQFLTAAAATISYKDLPLKIYELTRYSFRLEKAGELAGLKRLRAFTMPDMHTLCADKKQAEEEFAAQFRLCMGCLCDLGIEPSDYETAIRFTEEFGAARTDWLAQFPKLLGKPVLIERWSFRYAYFDPKFEFNIIDSGDRAAALSTVQIDHENGERFGIAYTDADNKRKHPLILHCSPSGGIDRVLWALLERAHMAAKEGKNPEFPLWLSPVQVRLCPVNDSFNAWADEIAGALASAGIRVDIDDRIESVQKKVRDAEMEWVPAIIVLGEKEKKSGRLAVRFRETGKVEQLAPGQLISWVTERTKGFPFKPLPLPRLLSKRPKWSV